MAIIFEHLCCRKPLNIGVKSAILEQWKQESNQDDFDPQIGGVRRPSPSKIHIYLKGKWRMRIVYF